MKVFASFYFKKKFSKYIGNLTCDLETNGCGMDEAIRHLEARLAAKYNAKNVVILNFTELGGESDA